VSDDVAAKTDYEERLFAVPDTEARVYDQAVAVIEQALDQVRTSLTDKRYQRDEVLAPEIRALVEEERRLARMLRVGKERDDREESP
jgi:hypothetical protein